MDKDKPTLKETLQSIDSTLERIERFLLNQAKPTSFTIDVPDRHTNDLVEEHT